ncbi:MAG: FAD-dependent monooxygenase [Hyphomicrobiaceae bacterium]
MANGMLPQSARESVVVLPVLVVGSGLAGLAMALALDAQGVAVRLVGPNIGAQDAARDTRSTALFGRSLDFLARTQVLDRLVSAPVPLVGLRLVDATGSLFRAPEVLFKSSEISVDQFGMNIENGPLLRALAERVLEAPGIEWIGDTVRSIETCEAGASVALASGETLDARLVIGADGERSLCRLAAGVGERTWTYPQVAIASRFAHRRPHGCVSTELHRRAGPLTTVPLAGDWSSLVWVDTPEEARRRMELGERAFAAELEAELGGILGGVTEVGARASFPLSGVTAERLGARRIALVGEAGHRLPPIGAQGLNLGLRDVAWLADLVADAISFDEDPGGVKLLEAYDRARRGDVAMRTAVVDSLNMSLLAGLLPVDMVRGAGLAALKTIGPLRRFFMREGMGPGGELPRLMQPVAERDGSSPN